MDFDLDISRVFGVAMQDGDPPQVFRLTDDNFRHPRWGQGMRGVMDKLGERSRRAQGLAKAVTYGSGMVLGESRVYVMASKFRAFGLLKMGLKRLYVARGSEGGLVEINPLCVLDFYVVEGHQRAGLGRQLFLAMLDAEGITPCKLAYDKPSPKLIGFLRRHFNLAKFIPQSNNFVVFDAYWSRQIPTYSYQAERASAAQSPAAQHSPDREVLAADPMLRSTYAGSHSSPSLARPQVPANVGGGPPARGKAMPPRPPETSASSRERSSGTPQASEAASRGPVRTPSSGARRPSRGPPPIRTTGRSASPSLQRAGKSAVVP
eukprot:CAMPEP_0206545098 /NCGR_PEP_ID=MMETSP0325_2-20121206/11934_1 /ASSEMBLY_ACC=CAM_ASM_000347 /TAXON_ID=2866 /ORGANISM="Crypthecodinium cohnii, Strain Seligo" /LENGTH=319 /DNA_ID=CAMNT_0054044019 /DNA_START=18 /DNA_END=975 /DNA_ORIENTATION=-